MVSSRVARSVIAELERRISYCKEQRQKCVDYLQRLKDKWVAREITYSEYGEIVEKSNNGKTIPEWIQFYEGYIKDCEERREHQEGTIRKNKIVLVSLHIIFGLGLILFLSTISPVLSGLFVQDTTQDFSLINTTFTESKEFEWIPAIEGELDFVKLSGTLHGTGDVKVYIDEYLILDSADIPIETPGLARTITGFFTRITGFVIGGEENQTEEQPVEDPVNETIEETNETATIENNETELTEEINITQTNETIEDANITSNQTEEQPTEQNITEEATEEIPEKPTEETETNVTTEEPEKEKIPVVRRLNATRAFSEICKETCSLSGLNRTKYTIRIEIDKDASIEIDGIDYAVKIPPEELVKEAVNITAENLTFIKTIPTIRVPLNGSAQINLTEYFSGAERYEFQASNITAIFNNEILELSPQPGFKGARKGKIIAYEGNNSLESNEFNILVSRGAITIQTATTAQIKVGEKVHSIK